MKMLLKEQDVTIEQFMEEPMRHQQYKEGLTRETARMGGYRSPMAQSQMRAREMRPKLRKEDIDLLFDNWLNSNFERIEVRN